MSAIRRAPAHRPQHSPLVTVLLTLGCLYCAECRGYMYPDHREHVSIFDTHTLLTFPAAPVTLTDDALTEEAA